MELMDLGMNPRGMDIGDRTLDEECIGKEVQVR